MLDYRDRKQMILILVLTIVLFTALETHDFSHLVVN